MKFRFFTATGGIDRRFLEQVVAARGGVVEADRDPKPGPADARILEASDTIGQTTTVD